MISQDVLVVNRHMCARWYRFNQVYRLYWKIPRGWLPFNIWRGIRLNFFNTRESLEPGSMFEVQGIWFWLSKGECILRIRVLQKWNRLSVRKTILPLGVAIDFSCEEWSERDFCIELEIDHSLCFFQLWKLKKLWVSSSMLGTNVARNEILAFDKTAEGALKFDHC